MIYNKSLKDGYTDTVYQFLEGIFKQEILYAIKCKIIRVAVVEVTE